MWLSKEVRDPPRFDFHSTKKNEQLSVAARLKSDTSVEVTGLKDVFIPRLVRL